MKSFLFRLILLLVLIPAAAAAAAWWYAHRPVPLEAPAVEFTVERGFTMRQAASAIADAGAQIEPEVLYWIARLGGKADRIVAGSYEIQRGATPWDIVLKLFYGDVSFGELLLVEGWNFRQVREAIETHPYLLPDSVDLSEAQILERIGATEKHPEGLFYPDTYRFDRYASGIEVFRAAYRAMRQHLDEAWAGRTEGLPLKSPYEALILASIIEKETGRAEERGLVASVFANRLKIGMRLQTDPTVIYGFGESFEGRLRRHHLETDHDYNTYMRAGLPPTPIAMPGRDSLSAAVNPERSEYLYFVSRGDGTSQFSRNLSDHNRAVNLYIRGRGG